MLSNPVDYSRNALLAPISLATLKDRYLLENEDPQDAFYRAAKSFSDDDAHCSRLYDYASRNWFMYSTPILSNAGTQRGLPISCYLNYVPDSRDGILGHYTENGWLASLGGGIGGYWGDVRSDGTKTSNGGKSTGSIPFLHVVDAQMLAFSQGTTRRGSYAAYQDIHHPEIEEFIQMRKPTGGDIHRKNLNLHHGVNITDAFMKAVEKGESYELIDPHTNKVVRQVDARSIWQLLLETRVATGEPYLHFIDTSNRHLPTAHRNAGLRVRQSNLCSEIVLPTNSNRTAVCCLSSVNLEKFDEWSQVPEFIPDLIRFLDNVLTSFITRAKDTIPKAVYSAKMERSIGLGAMGFHSYLQKNNIPFESAIAAGQNVKMFSHIKGAAVEATKALAKERGECPDSYGSGVRNMHLLAIAPNASSSLICGDVSPSIEPYRANAFTRKTMSGSFPFRNKYLEARLEALGHNTEEVWTSIVTNGGSVQHLDFLEDWDKQVFKTALEIDQRWIVTHAWMRQQFICQAQSVNLFFYANADVKYLHEVHMEAWKRGLKTLYYLRSESLKRPENITEKVERKVRKESSEDDGCFACEG